MSWFRLFGPAAGGIIAISLLASTAAADAIDGTWCAKDGRILEIKGAQVSTPGGNDIAGAYSRHAFSYVVPASEDPAGETVHMVLTSEDIVHLKVGRDGGDVEVWQRCETVS